MADELNVLSHGINVHLFGHDHASNLQLGLINSGYDPSFIDSYIAHYNAQNVWAKGFINFDCAVPVVSEQMCPLDRLLRSEFYNDWVKPQEDLAAGDGVILFKEEQRMIAIGGNIRRKDETKEKNWMQLLGVLAPHLQQAFDINRSLSGLNIRSLAKTQLKSSNEPSILIVDCDGYVVHLNKSANEMANIGHPFTLNSFRKFSFKDEALTSLFTHASRFASTIQNYTPKKTRIPNRTGDGFLQCIIAPVSSEQVLDMHVVLMSAMQRPMFMIAFSEGEQIEDRAARLGKQHELTRAEISITRAFAQGMTISEISYEREVSTITVRNQIKSIMNKCDVNRQSELMRLLH